jgi:molybdopterin converting factor subunit 1
MRSKLLFFGAVADAIGARELEVEIDESSRVNSVIENLAKTHPKLLRHKLLFAVNEQYVTENEPLKSGDEVAIFTPVSGG